MPTVLRERPFGSALEPSRNLASAHADQRLCGGRIGFAFDRFMVYGTGGYSFANIGYSFTNRLINIVESTEKVRGGWNLGAGAEFAVTQSVSARLEYRHTNYGSFSYDSLTAFPGLTGEQKPRMNEVRAGVSFRF